MTAKRFPLDADAIRELARLLDETGLAEIEVEDAGRKLRVVRGHGAAAPAPVQAPGSGEAEPVEEQRDTALQGAVHSPMVGTAYLAPEPGAKPFVKAGDRVEEGDTLMIIEAMKVMNPIRAPRAGVVSQVLAEDGRPVEYGQILMVIE